MNAPENHAHATWERILPQIRATRRKRRHRKIAAATVLCALLGIWLGIRFPHPVEIPASPPVAQITQPPPSTLAVMRVHHDGSVYLEEIACHELGPLELTLSLSPVIASALQD